MNTIYGRAWYRRGVARAVVTVAVGVVLVAWPTMVLDYLVKLIGAVLVVAGVVSLVVTWREREAERGRGDRTRGSGGWGLEGVTGAGTVVLGVVLWAMAGVFTDLLMWLFGLLLLVAGVGQVVLLLSARRWGRLPGMAWVFPLVVLLCGLVAFLDPFGAKEGLVRFFGLVVVFHGVTGLMNRYQVSRLWRMVHEDDGAGETRGHIAGKTGEVEDAEYEEVK